MRREPPTRTERETPPTAADPSLETVVAELEESPGGNWAKRRRPGATALSGANRTDRIRSRDGTPVVKLPCSRGGALVASGAGIQWDPGHGRCRGEWLPIEPKERRGWLALARAAREFVGASARTKGHVSSPKEPSGRLTESGAGDREVAETVAAVPAEREAKRSTPPPQRGGEV